MSLLARGLQLLLASYSGLMEVRLEVAGGTAGEATTTSLVVVDLPGGLSAEQAAALQRRGAAAGPRL